MSTEMTIAYGALLIALLLVLYLGFLRPDAKAKKEREATQEALEVGDEVFTKAGIHGVVTGINGELVLLEVGKAKTQLEVARWAILGLETQKSGGRFRSIPLNRGDGK